jgi:arylsulfatase A-like enzyme
MLLIITLVILMISGILLFNYYSIRKSSHFDTVTIDLKPIEKQVGENRCTDVFHLNNHYQKFDRLDSAPIFKLRSFPVDLNTISVISGSSQYKDGILEMEGEHVVFALFGLKDLVHRYNVDYVGLELWADKEVIIDIFSNYQNKSAWKEIKEFFRNVFVKRFGTFTFQVEVPFQEDFQAVSANLSLRFFKERRLTEAVVFKVRNKDNNKVKFKLRKLTLNPGINSKLNYYPTLSYFEYGREWIKSLFLPTNSRISYTIYANEPLMVDGYLGAHEGGDVAYQIHVNGNLAFSKNISGGLEYFNIQVEPVHGKIIFDVMITGDNDQTGILGNITFNSPNQVRKNIVLYLIDALRGDYGGLTEDPFEEYFKEGAFFANSYSNATKTSDSLPVLFSGKYKFMLVNNQKDSPFLPPNETLMAEYLKSKGYTTVAFITNPWLVSSNSHQGFDYIFHCWSDKEELSLEPNEKEYKDFKFGGFKEYLEKFVSLHAKKKLFIYIHTVEPHEPYELPLKYRNHSKGLPGSLMKSVHGKFGRFLKYPTTSQVQALKALYRDEVLMASLFFRKTHQYLKDSRILDQDSLLILTSDHGERFFEHQSWLHGDPDVYNEVIRIPLMIQGPGVHPGRFPLNVQLADIYPTVREWLGDKSLPELVGIPLLRHINNWNNAFLVRDIYSDGAEHPFQYSIIKNMLKIIVDGDSAEIYDLEKDPGEKTNLSKVKVFEILIKEARMFRNKFKTLEKKRSRKLSPEEMKRLKSLGYLD